jgi:hypothetical protein
MSESSAGKFRMKAWDGHPVAVDLHHVEPNGITKSLRLFGIEELYELQFVVARTLAKLTENTR